MLIKTPVAGFILVDFELSISENVRVLKVQLILKLSFNMISYMTNWVRGRHSKYKLNIAACYSSRIG